MKVILSDISAILQMVLLIDISPGYPEHQVVILVDAT